MFAKCMHMAVALAVSNPLCCCMAEGVLSDSFGASGRSHNCCSAPADWPASTEDSGGSHEPSDCGHKAFKDYLSSHHPGMETVMPLERAGLPLFYLEVVAVGSPSIATSSGSALACYGGGAHAPPPDDFQATFCIYRI